MLYILCYIIHPWRIHVCYIWCAMDPINIPPIRMLSSPDQAQCARQASGGKGHGDLWSVALLGRGVKVGFKKKNLYIGIDIYIYMLYIVYIYIYYIYTIL